jgi:anaerobic ribonucleoside-triphosphate reductase activating protein
MMLYLSRIHFPVTTLGPGNRIGIWFQGCSIRCKGCISVDTWGVQKGGVSVDEIISVIDSWLDVAEGITISGGEPFDQTEALVSLITQLRARTKIDIFVYSGYPFERIAPLVKQCDGFIDALISEPYEESAPQTLALRGSDNQKLHCLTPLGEFRFRQFDRVLEASDKTFDIMFEEGGSIWLAGVPGRDDMRRLQSLLGQEGHVVVTTEDKRLKFNEEDCL